MFHMAPGVNKGPASFLNWSTTGLFLTTISLRKQFNLQTGEIDCCVMMLLASLHLGGWREAKNNVVALIRLVEKALQRQEENGETKLWMP